MIPCATELPPFCPLPDGSATLMGFPMRLMYSCKQAYACHVTTSSTFNRMSCHSFNPPSFASPAAPPTTCASPIYTRTATRMHRRSPAHSLLVGTDAFSLGVSSLCSTALVLRRRGPMPDILDRLFKLDARATCPAGPCEPWRAFEEPNLPGLKSWGNELVRLVTQSLTFAAALDGGGLHSKSSSVRVRRIIIHSLASYLGMNLNLLSVLLDSRCVPCTGKRGDNGLRLSIL